MLSAISGHSDIRAKSFIVASAIGIALLIGSGLAADARAIDQIRPASAAENELVKAGHRYQLYLDDGLVFDGNLGSDYPENHRIGQE